MTPDGQAEEAVDLAHPLGVALGQVVVDGDDVDALAGERVEIDRQGRDQRLAFAGVHFGDLASCRTMPPISCTSKWRWPSVRLAASRTVAKAGDQDVVERVAVGEPLLEASVCARSSSSLSASNSGSSALIWATRG